MSNVYQKNISALIQKNPVLARRITDYVIKDVPQLINENGFYNLVYKNTPPAQSCESVRRSTGNICKSRKHTCCNPFNIWFRPWIFVSGSLG